MMTKLLGKTGILFLAIFGFAPFWLMYFLADVFYIFTYHIIGYRKKTVRNNLKNSFPEKTEVEIKQITKAFYRHLSDLTFETIKAF